MGVSIALLLFQIIMRKKSQKSGNEGCFENGDDGREAEEETLEEMTVFWFC